MSPTDLHHSISSHIQSLALPQPTDDQSAHLNEDSTTLEWFRKVHQHQINNNLGLKNYQSLLPITEIKKITDLPCLPTDAFKHSKIPSTLAPDQIKRTFLTSGTTTEIRGKHHFATTSTYETSILAAWKRCQLPQMHHTYLLTPSGSEAPHSSLSHMMETLKAQLAPSAKFLLNHGKLDHNAIIESAKLGNPITLLGTALAFLQLFKILEKEGNIQLPTGSWALETGGYKGRDESLTKEELYEKFQNHLAIHHEHIWNEYSMTELSSQFYTNGLGKPHIGPPWTTVKVIHPETNLPVSPGEIGYLVIYDLANIDSVLGIRTQDLAIYHTPHSFTLIGRDPSALPRGCSRSL